MINDGSLEATVWGESADPDGDGFSNLAEYHLGYEPTTPDGLDTLDGTSGSDPVVMEFFESKRAKNTLLKILGSADLGTWTQEAIESSSSNEGLLFNRVEATLDRDLSVIDRHFISLGVTPTP